MEASGQSGKAFQPWTSAIVLFLICYIPCMVPVLLHQFRLQSCPRRYGWEPV